MIDTLLLIPDKQDDECDRIGDAWKKQGGEVRSIDKFWIKPDTGDKKRFALYGNEMFCLVPAHLLEKQLIIINDELIARIDHQWTKRIITTCSIEAAKATDFPKFIKSVVPKTIPAKIYTTQEEFLNATSQLGYREQVIKSEVVDIICEVRVFVLDREVCDLAFYEGVGETETPKKFAYGFLTNCAHELPRTFVMDLGYNPVMGWFIIEFNSSWGAGLNYCDHEKILNCIKEATVN